MIKYHPLIKKLISLNLNTADYAVFGGGCMFAHGIRELGHDIDLVARGSAWSKAVSLGKQEISRLGGYGVVTLFNGEIEIFNGWAPGKWDVDELIDSAEVIEGIRFVKLGNVIKWKRLMGRAKDLEHIKLIEAYLRKE